MCICFDSVPVCNITEYRMNIFPPELARDQLLRRMLPPRFYILFQQFIILISKPCPLGYEISKDFKKCVCSCIIEFHNGVGYDLENYKKIIK